MARRLGPRPGYRWGRTPWHGVRRGSGGRRAGVRHRRDLSQGDRRLGEQILEAGGAIVSEYPPGSRPDAWRFPPRNRIIAGLSAAVVVVEAAKTGGALITAVKAAEYGIPVFAMPGDVDRRTSEGTNRLIRDGAFPVFDPDDLIEELDLVYGLTHRTREESPVGKDGC